MNLFGFRLARIIGDSMRPRLASGDYAVFGPARRLKAGEIVLVDHPAFGRVVKSIAHMSEHGARLEGLSPQSTSSARLGEVKSDMILGRMITSIKPAARLKGARPKTAMDSSGIRRAMTQ